MLIDKKTAEQILDPKLDEEGKLLFSYSEELAKYISESVNSNQLRKFFNEVKKIPLDDDKFKYETKKFLAVFLYSIYRSLNRYNEKVLKDFSESIKNMVLVISESNKDALKRFKDFFEALVAYHKFYNS
ncbi:MAG: type III-A CRISPR-associated protein Csm2 [Thermosipho sp. (in: Bacteria)]|nr:type III-A CRISPR-associated protein Csm2 [Thermosipho sp. (in: thermotogales)]